MSLKPALSFFLSLIIFFVHVVPAAAATITVSPGQSIQSAANSANSGDIITVLAGNYSELITINRSGIKIEANGTVQVKGFKITADDVSVKRFSITNLNNTEENGIDARGSNIVIEQNIINDVPSNGIEVRGSNSIIKNNIVTRGRNAGIFIAGQNNLIENNDVSKIIQPKPHSSGGDANCFSFFGSGHTFRSNYCHDIYSDGVLVTDAHIDAFQTWNWISMGGVGHDVLFEKNILMYPIKGQGYFGKGWNMEEGAYNITIKNNVILANLIVLIIDGSNISFLNNTLVGISNTSDGLHLRRTTVSMYNNIFAHQQQRIIENLESSSTITAGSNCYFDYGIILPPDPGDIRGQNPLFVNESARDYRLQPNSPCLGMGAESSGIGGSPSPSPSPTIYPGLSWWPAAVNPNLGDQINYQFSLPQSGNYIIKAMVNAPTDGDNSFLLDIDQIPQEPAQVWDIINLTTGIEERTVSLRGNGTFSQNEFTPKVFVLNQGTHTLYLIGREPGTQLSQLKLESYTPKPGDANGDNKVDGIDYVIWLNHYNQTISGSNTVGDFNTSGKVDGVDYVIWLNNYGM